MNYPMRVALLILGLMATASFGLCGQNLEATSTTMPALVNPYRGQALDNAVTRLQQKLDRGETTLAFEEGGLGYLRAVLRALDIDADSQLLVFSKTSLQFQHISPKTPRAIYFNDAAAVGFVPDGDIIEVAALDKHQGAIFYSLDKQKSDKPVFKKDAACLQCHAQEASLNVPGMVLRSVLPTADGTPLIGVSDLNVDHRTYIGDRWGGWFVSGEVNGGKHRGNKVVLDPGDPREMTAIQPQFDASRYASSGSDIVALMTLEHQVRMSNLLTRLGWTAQEALADKKIDEQERRKITGAVEAVVVYMLFDGEIPTTEPLRLASTFVASFARRGRQDKLGRSLRDFALDGRRLFRYRLSYMIYSPQFAGLPTEARNQVYARLREILSVPSDEFLFKGLTDAERRAVLEIVRDTKSDLPAGW